MNKAAFSPWHTKDVSFDQDQQTIITHTTKRSSFKPLGKNILQDSDKNLPSSRFLNKVTHRSKPSEHEPSSTLTIESKLNNHSKTTAQKKDNHKKQRSVHNKSSVKTSHRTQRQMIVEKYTTEEGQQFDDQRWKILALVGNDREKYSYVEHKKEQFTNLTQQIKSRRSARANSVSMINSNKLQPPKKASQILQQVSIKNFIIHGHYTDNQPYYTAKKKQTSYVMKQKFATLKKTIELNGGKENEVIQKKVIIKGNPSKEKQNIFKVIKLQTEINSKRIL